MGGPKGRGGGGLRALWGAPSAAPSNLNPLRASENVGKQLGMPVGPLAVSDEVSIELGYKITQATKKAMGDANH